ncbi:MAG: cyclase family protein, partial [Deinococcus sp.]|nr:cyclase family protein [Deinococcus sp.]
MPAVKRIIDLTADLYPNCPVCPGFTPPQITLIMNSPQHKWHMEQ